MIKLLFVCLGNICRSPAFAGYMHALAKKQQLEERFFIDSCGLHSSFLGSSPDSRMKIVASEHGIDLKDHQAKLFENYYFDVFDAIFGVTEEVVSHLKRLVHTQEALKKIHHATAFSQKYRGMDIPDPYYLGLNGFEKVWDMITDSCEGILEHFMLNK